MPLVDSPYTDADMIEGLYNDPENEILLAEYALATGGVQMGVFSSNFGQANIAEPVAGGSGPPRCFAGETLFTFFNGRQVNFEHLFEQRANYIGKGAKSFTPDNIIVPGKIRDVFRTKVYRLLHVEFEGSDRAIRQVPEHRYWISKRYFRPMTEIEVGQRVFTHKDDWAFKRVGSKRHVDYPEGVWVYNATIGIYHDYFAAIAEEPDGQFAVSNAKPPPDVIE